MSARRKQYAQYCSELIVDPSSFRDGGAVPLGDMPSNQQVGILCIPSAVCVYTLV